jgi:hypothetical protein
MISLPVYLSLVGFGIATLPVRVHTCTLFKPTYSILKYLLNPLYLYDTHLLNPLYLYDTHLLNPLYLYVPVSLRLWNSCPLSQCAYLYSGFNRCVSYRYSGFNRCVPYRRSGFNRCVPYRRSGFIRCVSYTAYGIEVVGYTISVYGIWHMAYGIEGGGFNR